MNRDLSDFTLECEECEECYDDDSFTVTSNYQNSEGADQIKNQILFTMTFKKYSEVHLAYWHNMWSFLEHVASPELSSSFA